MILHLWSFRFLLTLLYKISSTNAIFCVKKSVEENPPTDSIEPLKKHFLHPKKVPLNEDTTLNVDSM